MFPPRYVVDDREPRQPEAKAPVVHTESSPHYDDSVSRALVRSAIVKEAEASTALDGETQVVETVKPPSEPQLVPTNPNKEEPKVARGRRSKLPFGRKGKDVNEVTKVLEARGRIVVKSVDIHNAMDEKMKAEWGRAFGNGTVVRSQINSVLWSNQINASGNRDLVKMHKGEALGEYIIVSNKTKTPAERAPALKGQFKGPKADNVPEPQSRYTVIGRDLKGVPLHFDNERGLVGYMEFVPLEGTE